MPKTASSPTIETKGTRTKKAKKLHHALAQYTLFETAFGQCGIAWSERGLLAVQMPEKSATSTRKRLLQQLNAGEVQEVSPPAFVRKVIKEISGHLSGQLRDLQHVQLDMIGVPPFHKRVYSAARKIPCGKTVSYGQLAEAAGSPAAARAVGQALARNPFAIVVPCHRIIGHDGSAVGFSAHGGCDLKGRLLALEGIGEGHSPKRASNAKTAKKVRTFRQPKLDTIAATSSSVASKRRSDSKAGADEIVLSRREKRHLSATAVEQAESVSIRFAPGSSNSSLPFDPLVAIAHIKKNDRAMGKLIEKVGAYRLELDEMLTPFEALAESIVYQQLTGKAAATIFSRVKALYGGGRLPAAKIIINTPDEHLRGAGLSTAKTLAIKDLALKHHNKLIPSLEDLNDMDNDEIIEKLTAVRGIGRWTVEMLLMFRLGRPDVLPVNDYGVRKGFACVFGMKNKLPTPKELEAHGEKWRPYRSVASWYLWRALELPEYKKSKV